MNIRRGLIPGILVVVVVASVIGTVLGYGRVVFNAWFIGVCVLIVLGLLSMFYLLITGNKKKQTAQAELIGELPSTPADPGAQQRGPDTGLYLGSTMAPSWQNRVVVGDISDRASATIAEFAAGVLISRQGASDIWIPREAITAVRTERGIAGKVMSADGVLVIRWVLPSGTEIDSGIRADDKSIYPGWVNAFAGQHDSGQGTQE
ncbi:MULTISPECIES: hypothetical protein [Gordonia]|uniref:PH domain-containing protein n=1 Tax=Gordonia amicalis TaxID=89053 RepID=A0AAE4R1Z0_9ACTN|nr:MULTISPECIES: hypothetical protein [Gordonia]MCZ0913288.1 hypothetical protein [Gordonia amicalis]MCZ4577831.1 hypothetical protein [Gordonia amicalis]MCZ4652451.1 hypothetical protein [Gordonia amicalis]MDJ0451174.1 hypothetical protein [Gordonia amicalis]MDV6310657.1 hypothetical protein [Gordonia amicalis]